MSEQYRYRDRPLREGTRRFGLLQKSAEWRAGVIHSSNSGSAEIVPEADRSYLSKLRRCDGWHFF